MILSTELIRARKTKNRLIPLLSTPDKLSLAKTLIAIYEENLDKKRWELQDALDSCEELGYDFKLVRGLSEVLNSYSSFNVRSFIPPLKARSLIFQEAAKENVISTSSRNVVLSRSAKDLGVEPGELEESMYADLLDEQRLTDFSKISPDDLLKTYNFSLLCAILAFAIKIDFVMNGNVSGLKEASDALGEAELKGTSLIKGSILLKPLKQIGFRGSKIEMLLSKILNSRSWQINADVSYPPRNSETRPLEIDSSSTGSYIKTPKIEDEMIIEIEAPIRKSSFGEIIVIDDVTRRYDLTDRELMRKVKEENVHFIKLPGVLITPNKFELIKADLASIKEDDFNAYKDVLKGHGVKNPIAVLEALGFLIESDPETRRLRVYHLKRRSSS